MINHKAIVDRFAMYAPSMEAARSQGIAYAITEDAAVLGGAPTSFSGGFGYALWAVDFNLAAMARGVSRVTNLAGRPSAKRVFWVPDGSAGEANPGPHVRAPFPAAMFVADFVGMGGPEAVKELVIGGADLLSAYAMYDDETRRLERVALVNMRLYNGTSSGEQERPKETFQVAVPDGVKSARVRRLRADLGVASMGYDFGGPEHNVTWAGEQWTYAVDQGSGHFPSGGVVEKMIEAQAGTVTVVVPNSEAVILFMQY
jgi:hypothetical protein